MVELKYSDAKPRPARPRSSAVQHSSATLRSSSIRGVSHDDNIFPRGRDRRRVPAPDKLRVRANHGAGRPEGPVAGKHDVGPAGEGAARKALPGLATHDHRLAERQAAKAGEVGLQAPGKAAGGADDAVGGAGDGAEGEDRAQGSLRAQTAIGALIAGWAW